MWSVVVSCAFEGPSPVMSDTLPLSPHGYAAKLLSLQSYLTNPPAEFGHAITSLGVFCPTNKTLAC